MDLGRQPYRPVWSFQRELQRRRIDQEIPDTLLLVEHDPVYTIGKNGSENHVIAGNAELASRGIDVVAVDRGGDVTYHGPGQMVGYPIFDLHQHRQSISWYMRELEGVFITLLAEMEIAAARKPDYTGVWIGDDKILAMGVRISRWVTMHGFAFNIEPDLAHFGGIIPCGIFHMGVTSLREQLGRSIPWDTVKERVIAHIRDAFAFDAVETVDGRFDPARYADAAATPQPH